MEASSAKTAADGAVARSSIMRFEIDAFRTELAQLGVEDS